MTETLSEFVCGPINPKKHAAHPSHIHLYTCKPDPCKAASTFVDHGFFSTISKFLAGLAEPVAIPSNGYITDPIDQPSSREPMALSFTSNTPWLSNMAVEFTSSRGRSMVDCPATFRWGKRVQLTRTAGWLILVDSEHSPLS